MRTIVDLPDESIRELDAYCERQHISRAEAVRRAVREFLDRDEEAFDLAFGSWGGRAGDGVDFQRRLRAEWDDR